MNQISFHILEWFSYFNGLCLICILKGGLSAEKSSCPLANMSICIWDSSGGTHSSTTVTQPSTEDDRLRAVGCRADIPHLSVVEFLNSIINYFSVFTLNTTKYELHLLAHNNQTKPRWTELPM